MNALLRTARALFAPAGHNLKQLPAAIIDGARRLGGNEGVLLAFGAVLMGIIGTAVAIGIRSAAGFIQFVFYGAPEEKLITQAQNLDWWHILAVTTIGGLVVGYLNYRLFGGRSGRGAAHVIECVHIHQGKMGLRQGLISGLLRVASIGTGSSIGREGAILHFSNTIASQVGQHLPFKDQHIITLMGCVTASAVAGSYNAPIAGVFFALEVVLGGYALSAFAPVVIASVIGTMLSRQYYGPEPSFGLPHYEIVTYLEFPAFMLLGLVCAVVGMIFMWSTFFVEDTMAAVTKRLKLPSYVKTAVGGAMVGGIAVFIPHVLGVGYEATNAALNNQFNLTLLLLLPVAKVAATAISVGAGFGGGIFSPAMFIGASTGGAFGLIAAGAFPELDVNAGLYAIVGMTAMAASVLGAPITAILIVFELTGDVQVTIGVMTGAAVSAVISNQVVGHSYYTWRIARRGIELKGGRARMILKQTKVSEVCERHFQTVPETMRLTDLKQLLHLVPEDQRMFVVAEGNRLLGTVSLQDIKDVAFDPLVYEEGIEAVNVAYVYEEVLALDDSLEDALGVFERTQENELPVVQDRRQMVVAGMLSRQQITQAYNEALLQAEKEYSR